MISADPTNPTAAAASEPAEGRSAGASNPAWSSREGVARRCDLDIARAIAISLVVVHHLSQYFERYRFEHFSAGFGRACIAFVEVVHIPIFIFVAGYVLSFRPQPLRRWSEIAAFEKKKAFRLLLPYLSIGLIQAMLKLALDPWAQSRPLRQSLRDMTIAPLGGPAPHMWFIYVLMIVFAFWPILHLLVSGRLRIPTLAVALGVALYPIRWPSTDQGFIYAGLSNLTWYLPMFIVGYCYGHRLASGQKGHLPWRITTALAAGVLLGIHWWNPLPQETGFVVLTRACRMAGSLAAAVSICWVGSLLWRSGGSIGSLLSTVGLYSYDIYLLHVAFGAHPLVLAMSRLGLRPIGTYAAFVLALPLIVGIGLLEGQIIRRIHFASFIILGVPYKRTKSG